jgi:2'-5' RNA ligase
MIAIHQSLEKVGFPVDRQNLVPHLTLGRIKELNNPTFFWKIFNQYKSISSKQISINDIVLYESILKKEGPLYINLTSCSLIQKRP